MVGKEVETLGRDGSPEQAVLTPYYPYCAIRSIITGIDLVRRKGVNRIDESILVNHVFGDEIYKLQGALQFLGLTDKDGNITNEGTLFQNSRRPAPAIRRVVTTAYGRELVKKAEESSNAPSDLKSFFMENNGGREKMADRSSRVFLELLRMGGVELRGMPRRRLPRPRTKRPEQIVSPNQIITTVGQLMDLTPSKRRKWMKENTDYLVIPSSYVLTVNKIQGMDLDQLTEWFKKRLPPREPESVTDSDNSPTTIFPMPENDT